jgi:DNA-directed RNA polymerase specialized sigma24 family protein
MTADRELMARVVVGEQSALKLPVTLYRRGWGHAPLRPFSPCLYDPYGASSLEEVKDAPAEDLDTLGVAERWEQGELVHSAIQGLPPEQREAFILRHDHGLSDDEIAKVVEALPRHGEMADP